MKKTILGTLLLSAALKLLMLTAAGDAFSEMAQKAAANGKLISATLSLELGNPKREEKTLEISGTEGLEESGKSEGAESAEEYKKTGAPIQSGAPAGAAILSAPGSDAESEPEPASEGNPAPEVRETNLSADTKLDNLTDMDLDLNALASEGLSLSLPREGPQVLIIHTHTSEAYTQEPFNPYEESDPYRTEDRNYSVVRVGDVLAEKLTEAGLQVLHDTEIYDYPSYTGSYSRSGAAVENYLAEYPSLSIVIDLHRDALGSGDVIYKTKAQLSGQDCAQVLFIVGTGENGLPHPHWRDNLKLALYMQNAVDSRYPSLSRPIALVKERYNQHLSTGMLILEVGSTGNTLSEAVLAAELFARCAGPALADLIG